MCFLALSSPILGSSRAGSVQICKKGQSFGVVLLVILDVRWKFEFLRRLEFIAFDLPVRYLILDFGGLGLWNSWHSLESILANFSAFDCIRDVTAGSSISSALFFIVIEMLLRRHFPLMFMNLLHCSGLCAFRCLP